MIVLSPGIETLVNWVLLTKATVPPTMVRSGSSFARAGLKVSLLVLYARKLSEKGLRCVRGVYVYISTGCVEAVYRGANGAIVSFRSGYY